MKDRFNQLFRLLDDIQNNGQPLMPTHSLFDAVRSELEHVQQELVAKGIDA